METRIGAIVSTDFHPLEIRRLICAVRNEEPRPSLLVIFLTGCENFSDALVCDLLDESILLRCAKQDKSSAEATTFALRLAFAEEVDYFATLSPRHIYRKGYFAVIDAIAKTDQSKEDGRPRCWNLINQEWLPRNADRPVGFHFRGGLGLSDDEKKSGQELGAPDTFVINRAAARVVLTESWKHPWYGHASYDLVWRQTLLGSGINISLAETTNPIFVFVEKGRPTGFEDRQAESQPAVEATPNQFPPGLRDSRLAVPLRLKAGAQRSTPEVSIVIPTYNEGDWLFHTVDSLHRMATNHSIEIIVVDDGCNDGSIEKMQFFPDVVVVKSPHPQAGLISAKNTGGAHARGDYLCFVDSHMLMPDHWLDTMLSTAKGSDRPAFVTCGITDVMHYGTNSPLVGDQYGYTLSDWTFNVRWHHYGRGKHVAPFRVPLCPGGMSLMRRDRFEELGGFCKVLRKWGSEDVELSLRNYCAGGETLSEPRTHVYHYFKNHKNRKPTFSITFAQTAFNALFVAKTYFSAEDYERVKVAFLRKAKLQSVINEVEASEYEEYASSIRQKFVRQFADWRQDFVKEMQAFEGSRPENEVQPVNTGIG